MGVRGAGFVKSNRKVDVKRRPVQARREHRSIPRSGPTQGEKWQAGEDCRCGRRVLETAPSGRTSARREPWRRRLVYTRGSRADDRRERETSRKWRKRNLRMTRLRGLEKPLLPGVVAKEKKNCAARSQSEGERQVPKRYSRRDGEEGDNCTMTMMARRHDGSHVADPRMESWVGIGRSLLATPVKEKKSNMEYGARETWLTFAFGRVERTGNYFERPQKDGGRIPSFIN